MRVLSSSEAARILRQNVGSGWFDLNAEDDAEDAAEVVVAAGQMPTTAPNYELLVNTTTFKR